MELIIGFSRPKDFKIFSFGVRLQQGWTDYSHVFISLLDTRTNKDIVYEASHGDIHPIELTNFKKRVIITEEYKFNISEEQAVRILEFCQDSFQKKYGFLTILGIALNSDAGKDGDKTFICSEFAARILEVAELIDDVYDVEAITPKEINGLIKRLIREKKLNPV